MRYLFYTCHDPYCSYICAVDSYSNKYYYMDLSADDSYLLISDGYDEMGILADIAWNLNNLKWGNDLGYIYDYKRSLHST